MSLASRSVAVVTITLASLSLASSARADVTSTTLTVDTRGTAVSGTVGTAATADVLTTGVTYDVAVGGTYSPWQAALYSKYPQKWVNCGTIEAAPAFPTPGNPGGPVTNDAAFQFGSVQPGGCGTRVNYPYFGPGIEISTGGVFSRPTLTGVGALPSADHVYRFTVTGAGAPFAARIRDVYANDNYGELRFSITRAGTTSAVTASSLAAPAAASTPLVTTSSSSSSRICTSRRTIVVHVSRKQLKSIGAKLSGPGLKTPRTLKVTKGKLRSRIPVSLRGLLKARYRVTVKVTLSSGKKATIIRRFKTCTPKGK